VDSSLGQSPARQRFAELIRRPVVPLAEAALAIAAEEYPNLAADVYLGRIDALARAVDARLPARRDTATTLRLLRTVLFEEGGFRGNAEAYYDPRNSFLNEVLDRRLGIPITLGVIYMEVAARVGLPIQGVRFPGHFLVKYVAGQREIFIDPFHGGEILSADDCVARLGAMAPGRSLEGRHLQPATTRQILRRMLHNLEKIYVESGDDVRALWVVDRLALLAPDDPVTQRDRGLVEARLGGIAAALSDLQAYLVAEPAAADADEVRALVDQLLARPRFLN
jgi:regulator of sirC expression with transglutaminase-like and TPR domain